MNLLTEKCFKELCPTLKDNKCYYLTLLKLLFSFSSQNVFFFPIVEDNFEILSLVEERTWGDSSMPLLWLMKNIYEVIHVDSS